MTKRKYLISHKIIFIKIKYQIIIFLTSKTIIILLEIRKNKIMIFTLCLSVQLIIKKKRKLGLI